MVNMREAEIALGPSSLGRGFFPHLFLQMEAGIYTERLPPRGRALSPEEVNLNANGESGFYVGDK